MVLSTAACVSWRSRPPAEQQAAQATFGNVSTGRIAVHDDPGRPRFTSIVRQGDPAGAIAALVLTGGDGQASVALATIVAERLKNAQGRPVEVHSDRLGYRISTLVQDPNEARAWVAALRNAFERPIQPDSPETKAAANALQSLRGSSPSRLELDAINACTGEIAIPASTTVLVPSTPDGARILEQWRASFHGAQRIAFATVGSSVLTTAVHEELNAGSPWPTVTPSEDPWPEADTVEAVFLTGSRTDTPVLTLAARVSNTFAVTRLTETTFAASGPLAQRLAAATAWRLARSSATVRPRGACLALSVERDPALKDVDLTLDAARVAAWLSHEMQGELQDAYADASVAGEIVLRTSNPQQAASIAAWWSHAARLQAGPSRVAIALGLPPPKDIRDKSELGRTLTTALSSFQSSLPTFSASWQQPNIDTISRLEEGQGEFWLLLANRCGTTAETGTDVGYSALAAIAAAHHHNGKDDVTLEPWIAQDGLGILAHASPKVGEHPSALARRVANAAASAMLGPPPPEYAIQEARHRLIAYLHTDGPQGEGFGMLAKTLSPRQPAWLAPYGLYKTIVQADVQSITLRHAALASGPLRLAVLANSDAQQVPSAARVTDRWIIHRSGSPRTCSPSPPPSSGPDATNIALHSDTSSQAWIGVAQPSPSPSDRLMFAMLREILAGSEGMLPESFRSLDTSLRAEARTTGQRRMTALVLSFRGADEAVDRALQLAQMAMTRLRQGNISEQELRRTYTLVETNLLHQRLDPRVRIAQTWRQETSLPPMPSIQEWKTWVARTVSDERIVTIRVRPHTSNSASN